MAKIEDMSDAIDELESGSYWVVRQGPSPTVGGRSVPAVLAAAWEAARRYVLGDRVVHPPTEGHAYRCVQAGPSSGSGPTGTGSGIVDGGAKWDWIGPAAWLLPVSGSLQPVHGAQLDRLAELYKTREIQLFFTATKLRGESKRGEPDRVRADDDLLRFDSGPGFDSGVLDGSEWVVQDLQRWHTLGGFHRAALVRVGRL